MPTTFQIQYIHPIKGVQLAYEKAESKEDAQLRFEKDNEKCTVLDCRCVEGQPSGFKKP